MSFVSRSRDHTTLHAFRRHTLHTNGALQQYCSPRPTLAGEFPRRNHLFPQPSSSMFCAHFPLPLLPRTPTTFIAFPPNPLLLGPRRSNGGKREKTITYMKHAVLKEKGVNDFLLENTAATYVLPLYSFHRECRHAV